VGPEQDQKNDQRTGTPLLQTKAEKTGIVHPGEVKALGSFNNENGETLEQIAQRGGRSLETFKVGLDMALSNLI